MAAFGRFEILGRVAYGGMAEIFLGRETNQVGATRLLAIKRILPHVASEKSFVDMFFDEARLAIQLNHPNICHVYEFGEVDGAFFLAMEWIHGVSLTKLIRRSRSIGGLSAPMAARIVATVCDALRYAHRARDANGRALGIVHRDVTPQNIMISYGGQVKLLDFGVAKASSHSSRTEAGTLKGKLSYMSPQQILGAPLDARADVFALGVCLFEALTCQSLFRRASEYDTVRAIIEEPSPRLRDRDPSLPPELDAIVSRAVQKEATDRFGSAGDMQAALERWIASTGEVVTTATIAETMEALFPEEAFAPPTLEPIPFGQSLQLRPPVPALRAPVAPGHRAHDDQDAGRSSMEPTQATPALPPAKGDWLRFPAPLALFALMVGAAAALWSWGSERPAVESGPPSTRRAEAAVEVSGDPAPLARHGAQDSPPEPAPIDADIVPAVRGSEPSSEPPAGEAATATSDERPTPAIVPVSATTTARAPAGLRRVRGRGPSRAGEPAREARPDATASEEPEGATGRLSINTRPASQVFLRGRRLGSTPLGERTVPAGALDLSLVDADGTPHRRTVHVEPGGEARVFFDLTTGGE